MVVRLRALISLITCGSLVSTALAAPSNIGIVMTAGSVQVDGTSVRGTSVLFGGSVLTSENAGTRLEFADGTHATLQQGAKMQVYREHSVLEHGVAMQQGIDKHAVLADGLRVSGVVKNASALVRVIDAAHVEVAAQSGESDVSTSDGRLVARVEAGKVLSFALDQAQGMAATHVKLRGKLRPHYLLTDDQTQVTYQLQGAGLDPLVGSSVEVTGDVTATNAAGVSIIVVSHVVAVSAAEAVGAASGIAAAVTGPSWAASSLIFLVAAVAGGSVVGLAAAGVLSPPSTNAVTPTQP